ncbi:E3 ubiquitin-protein ligase RBBP6-like [Cuculus canorus]|uniref:E3 ubiquitin-protein ligase RBBP6-like n=1 Tax=Cuculus canorus TaxID=55661 RepID=UPI0023AB02BB|nr:E3 ubiquitin-protein ligase RBBP6-like [Cuculus canorus]
MPCIHYKFFSRLNYDTVSFSGLDISLGDLKHQIMSREKLKASRCELQISNAQTGEEYTDENTLVPRNSSVIVRRIPAAGVKVARKRCVPRGTEAVRGTPKAVDDSSAPMTLAQLIKIADLAGADVPEADKIKAMMIQSSQDYDPINYVKTPPSPYTWLRDGKPGHYVRNGPDNGGRHFGSVPRIRKCTGIPKSFLKEVEDPNTKGAMLANTGKYVIPILNAEVYAREKKKKPPLLAVEPSSSSSDPVPEEQLPLTPPPAAFMAVSPPAAPGCPVQSQPAAAAPVLPGPQGQSMPTAAHPKRGGKRPSAGGRADWELETKKSKLDQFTNEFAEESME